MPHNTLGSCSNSMVPDGSLKCGGQLEISGDEVRCQACGCPQTDHPEQKRIVAWKAAEKAKPPQRVELRPEDNEGHRQFMEQRNILESVRKALTQLASLSDRVNLMGERLTRLEEAATAPRQKIGK